jgi:hypothetical protein
MAQADFINNKYKGKEFLIKQADVSTDSFYR